MNTVRAFTWLDLIVCAAFAIPVASNVTLSLLNTLSSQLGLAPVGISTATAGFFVNLAGLFGVLWNIAMLSSQDRKLHQVDLMARVWLIGVIVFYMAGYQLSAIFAVFIVTEIVGGWFKWRWLQSDTNRA